MEGTKGGKGGKEGSRASSKKMMNLIKPRYAGKNFIIVIQNPYAIKDGQI